MISKQLFMQLLFYLLLLSVSYEKMLKLALNKPVRHGRLLQEESEAVEIPVEYEEGEQYFIVELGMGTPKQVFEVQVDTTTSVTWVPSINCENCNSSAYFNSSRSKTVTDTNKTVEIEDEDGDVKGYETYDDITLEGMNLTRFGFIQVYKTDDDFEDHPQGKLGLGYRHEHGHDFNLLERLKLAGVIDNKIFTIEEENSTHGWLTLGEIPEEYENYSYSSCNVTITEDLDDEYRPGWVCEMSHILFGEDNKTFSKAIDISGRAIFDSGYNYISVPTTFKNLFKQNFLDIYLENACQEISEDDEVYYLCKGNLKDIEDATLTFILQGYGYVIPAVALFEQKDPEHLEFQVRFFNENDNIWSFGSPFMSQYAVVFNAEDGEVGFFKGEKESFEEEWYAWYNGSSFIVIPQDKMTLLIIGASVLGGILLIVVVCLIVHSIRKRRPEENKPLIKK